MDPRDHCIAINSLFSVLLTDKPEEVYVNQRDAVDRGDMVSEALRKIQRNLERVVRERVHRQPVEMSVEMPCDVMERLAVAKLMGRQP